MTDKTKPLIHGYDGEINSNITLRDYFAAHALQGLLAVGAGCGPSECAYDAYLCADAMLEEREVNND